MPCKSYVNLPNLRCAGPKEVIDRIGLFVEQYFHHIRLGCITQRALLSSGAPRKATNDLVERKRMENCPNLHTSLLHTGGSVRPYAK